MSTAEYNRVIANRQAAEARVDGAESKACASGGVEPDVFFPCVDDADNTRLNRLAEMMRAVDAYAFDYAKQGKTAASRVTVERAICAALASPAQAPAAPSVGEPVAQWQTSASGEGGWMNIDADEVEFCRDKRGYKVRALVLATPPAAPAATEAPSEQEEKLWGEFLADLEQIRPIGKRHAGMLKAVKKYRLLGEG